MICYSICTATVCFCYFVKYGLPNFELFLLEQINYVICWLFKIFVILLCQQLLLQLKIKFFYLHYYLLILIIYIKIQFYSKFQVFKYMRTSIIYFSSISFLHLVLFYHLYFLLCFDCFFLFVFFLLWTCHQVYYIQPIYLVNNVCQNIFVGA